MTEAKCPQCDFPRGDESECKQCGIVFARYRPRPEPRLEAVPSEEAVLPEEAPDPGPGPVRRFYRVFRWVVLGACLLVFALVWRRSPPPVIEVAPEAPVQLEDKLQEMDQAVAEGLPHTLQLNEGELNTWLQQNLALAGRTGAEELALPAGDTTVEEVQSTVRDVKIELVGDLLRAYVVFDFHGKDLSLLLEGRLRAEAGYIRFDPTAALLGSLPLPQATLERAVSRLFDAPENKEQFRLPPDVTDIRVEDGELQISREFGPLGR